MLAIPAIPIFELEGVKSLEVGKLLELDCEVADSTMPVCWYKDGVKLLPQKGWNIQSNGTLRRLIIPSAEVLHSGLYSCETSDDTIHFTVDIKGDFHLKLVKHRPFWTPNSINLYNMHTCLSVVFRVES